ncbi:MAG: methionyl-tRNA formyltransferase [Candidatus Sumerlaeia bacterium]|nr:methionyl-tRNA formyltransferase [Candidatus Sumerlaeia bacterium]
MRLLFMGTPEFADVCLRRLLESEHEVLAVICQPDRPVGRGQVIQPPPTKVTALAHGIPVLQPERIRRPEALQPILEQYPCDAAIVVAYGQLLPKAILDHPRFGCLNIHASLLPKYRGAAPIQWALAEGEKTTGVTIMQLDEGMDTGPIVRMQEVDILEDDDARSLMDMLAVVGADLLLQVLQEVEESGEMIVTEQDHSKATHAPLIQKSDAVVDWKSPAERIICRARGFALWPGASTTLGDREVKITGIEAASREWVDEELFEDEQNLPAPGTILGTFANRGVVVQTGQGLVLITRIKFAGKQEVEALAALNGKLITVGQRFGG